jgi:hypothetical protein
MSEVPIPTNQLVTVMVAQTTFAVLTMPGKQFRVDFLEKAEARLKPGMRGKFAIEWEHPLLMKYNDPLVTIYITSRPQNAPKLFEETRQRIEMQLQGWRHWSSVTLEPKVFQQNLVEGSGMLLQAAPAPIAQAVVAACTAHNASTYSDPTGRFPVDKPVLQLLLVGEGYVIAQDFRFTQL